MRDIGSHPDWMHDAERVRFASPRRDGVGTTFEVDTRVGPFRLTDPMEVTEWEEGRAIGVRHGGVVTGTGRFTLEALPGDRTRFTWEEELTFPWWMAGPVGAAVAARLLRLVWERSLTNLQRRFLEPR